MIRTSLISARRAAFIYIMIFTAMISCFKEKKSNEQPLDQYNIDNSNDYRYIFKDVIRKEKERERKSRKGEFE